MEKESFEDEQVAKVLADKFIAIKVDREERPDIDSIYMNASGIMTGSGGWPLSIFMDCEQRPFFAGTYYPKRTFLALLDQVSLLWANNRGTIDKQAGKLSAMLTEDRANSGILDASIPQQAFLSLQRRFDRVYGGFDPAPKFPSPHILMFLLRYCTKNKDALTMVTKTLDAYRDGGLFDQIGFGFFRYSTDRQIRIPHFEKMLYDNALLCLVYAEAFALTGETRFAQTAREVITYLCRDMRSADGGFYTAEDADSEDEEGKFYIFEKDEMEAILAEDAEAFLQIFPVSAGGNFDEKNHLYVSDRQLMDSDETLVSRCREKLMNVRNTRIRPLRDEKIIAGQNGMALAALAVSGRILNDPAIIKLARETEAFIRERLTDPSGHLTSCIIDGKKGQPGFSDDYTFCVYGLLELYFSTGEDIYLQRASQLNAVLLEDFYCPGGGFYQSGTQGETLIANFREIYDGAVPSANAVAVHNLLRLSRLSHDDVLFDIANESLTAFMGTIADSPVSHCFSCINLLLVFGGVADIVLIGKSLDDINKLRKAIPYHSAASIRTIVEEDRHYPLQDGCATAYVCANNRCYPPVSDAAELIKLLSASDASIYTAEQTP